MPIPVDVQQLIDQFDTNHQAYRAGQCNEAQVRQEFINPLFAALGWDVYNTQGYSEKYKEVVHEDAITVQGKSKAPQAKRLLQQQIDLTDRQIDALVYDLYDLTEEEIAIVESST